MRLVVDTGALLATLDGTSDKLLRAASANALYMTPVNFSELLYVLCRRLGAERATSIARSLLRSGVLHVVSPPGVHARAALCKCRHSIALADCYSVALAQTLGMRAVFHREKELEKAAARDEELRRLVVFLDEL